MITKQEYTTTRLIRFLEITVAALLVAVGSMVAFYAARDMITFISDFMWRWSKGYLRWEMQGGIGAYIISLAMLSAACFIIANALYRGHWSRRTTLWVIGISMASAVAFAIALAGLFIGFSGLEDF